MVRLLLTLGILESSFNINFATPVAFSILLLLSRKLLVIRSEFGTAAVGEVAVVDPMRLFSRSQTGLAENILIGWFWWSYC